MKKWTALVIVVFLLLLNPALVMANNADLSFYVNGHLVEAHQDPVVDADTLYISVPVLEQHFGFSTVRDERSQSGKVTRTGLEIEYADSDTMVQVNGNSEQMPASIWTDHGTPYLPLRWLSEQAGWKLQTDPITSSIFVYVRGQDQTATEFVPAPNDLKATEDRAEENRSESVRTQPDEAVEPPLLFPDEVQLLSLESHLLSLRTDSEELRLLTDSPVEVGDENAGQVHSKIVLELPRTVVTDTLREEVRSWHPTIDSRFHSIDLHEQDNAHPQMIIRLKQAAEYVVFQDYRTSEVVLQVHETEATTTADWTIVIDPGHGGSDPGATGASARHEKHYTLAQSIKIAEKLRADGSFKVVITRTEDEKLELEERARLANDTGADLFISIHGNHFDAPVSGTETYYYDENSKRFAEVMHQHVLEATGFADRGVRNAKFKVLDYAAMPAVLLEIGFLSNTSNEQEMYTDAFQERVADAVVAGIRNYLQLE